MSSRFQAGLHNLLIKRHDILLKLLVRKQEPLASQTRVEDAVQTQFHKFPRQLAQSVRNPLHGVKHRALVLP